MKTYGFYIKIISKNAMPGKTVIYSDLSGTGFKYDRPVRPVVV